VLLNQAVKFSALEVDPIAAGDPCRPTAAGGSTDATTAKAANPITDKHVFSAVEDDTFVLDSNLHCCLCRSEVHVGSLLPAGKQSLQNHKYKNANAAALGLLALANRNRTIAT
jgi:hypothetical protein